MRPAEPSCRCRRACTRTERRTGRSAASSWWRRTPTSGAPRRRSCRPSGVAHRTDWRARRCAIAGGCSWSRSLRSRRSGVAAPAGPAVMTPLWQRLSRVFGRRDAGAREEAERILLEADFGVAATAEILEQVARTPDGDARPALEQAVVRILSRVADPGALARAPEAPTVMVVFGVNGVGKTTTVAKLARRLVREGRSVLLAAADTFRAGAREQLEVWADRLGGPR